MFESARIVPALFLSFLLDSSYATGPPRRVFETHKSINIDNRYCPQIDKFLMRSNSITAPPRFRGGKDCFSVMAEELHLFHLFLDLLV